MLALRSAPPSPITRYPLGADEVEQTVSRLSAAYRESATAGLRHSDSIRGAAFNPSALFRVSRQLHMPINRTPPSRQPEKNPMQFYRRLPEKSSRLEYMFSTYRYFAKISAEETTQIDLLL